MRFEDLSIGGRELSPAANCFEFALVVVKFVASCPVSRYQLEAPLACCVSRPVTAGTITPYRRSRRSANTSLAGGELAVLGRTSSVS